MTESRLSIDENEFSLDEISIAVDDNGRCYLNLDDDASSKTWRCYLTCLTLDSEDKQIIIHLVVAPAGYTHLEPLLYTTPF